jgi:hypothetical protein
MDTRFWGPSGWKLLHLITFDYTYSSEHAITYANFFETIPYILPCKFCRSSLTDYYKKYPYHMKNDMMDPMLDIKKWMYLIHNCVNDKLRKQGLYSSPNPSYAKVKVFYKNIASCPWERQLSYMWDFFFSVAYHHPKERSFYSKPMPECPTHIRRCNDPCEKNKWNVLPLKERIYWFYRFWTLLPAVLPIKIAMRWKEVEKVNPPTLSTRQSTITWLWKMRCGLDTDFKDPYTTICKKISNYSSDCGTQKGVFTCRRKKHKQKHKTVKKSK